jgi:hypothetical protein
MKILFLCISIFSVAQISAQTYGCRDVNAINFNPNATDNDGSCLYSVTNYKPTYITNLESTLNESSALIIVNNDFWTLNDSENLNAIYQINASNGAVMRTVTIKNAVNTDWESIAQSDTHLFIGDFGNNSGTRKNLRILKVSKTDLANTTDDTVTAEIIDFTYSDQTTFTSAPNATNFDGEALIFAHDSLHIFSKNWANLKTKHYQLTANAGSTIATLQEEFDVAGLITDASISPETGNIVLIGYKNGPLYSCFSWLLSDYQRSNFFSGNKRLIELGSSLNLGQTEGISLKNDNTGFFTSELVSNSYLTIPPKLYSFNFNNFFGTIPNSTLEINERANRVYPNPCFNQITIESSQPMLTKFSINNMLGSKVVQGELVPGKNNIDLNSLPRGSYVISFEGNNKQVTKLIK